MGIGPLIPWPSLRRSEYYTKDETTLFACHVEEYIFCGRTIYAGVFTDPGPDIYHSSRLSHMGLRDRGAMQWPTT